MKLRSLLVLSAVLLGLGCEGHQTPTSPATPTDPSKIISDGAHGGNKDFFFLPPMVPLPLRNPDFEVGKFNNGLKSSLKVEICELKALNLNAQGLPTETTPCAAGAPVKTFAPGSVQLVNLPLRQNGWWSLLGLPADGFYYVLWDTRQSNLSVSKYYRIKVLIDGNPTPLGVADVDPMSNLSQWKYTLTSQVIQLVDDVMLPIPFRVENGGGSTLCGTSNLCASATVSNNSPTGFQTVTVDGGAGAIAGVTFPNGWLPAGGPQNVVVTIAKVDIGATDPVTGASLKPCHVGLPLLQFPGCFNFSTTPHLAAIDESGRQFATPVTVAVCYSLQGSGDPREKFAEMYASGPNEPPHALRDADDAGILSAAARNCNTTPAVIGAVPGSGLTQLASATWTRMKSGLGSVFGVKTAYGVDLGLGGFMNAFSNVGPALEANIQAVGSTGLRAAAGDAIGVYVRLTGSNHHDGQHENTVGLAGLTVHFAEIDGDGALGQLGETPGVATQLDVATNSIAIDPESPVSGGGYAAVTWRVPSTPGVYHLSAAGPALGGPVTFAVTVVPVAIDLGALIGDSFSNAMAVNSSGQIVGYSGGDQGPTHAVLWNDGAIIALNLPTDQGGGSRATGINDNGVIVGEMIVNGQNHAFRWENGVATDLGAPTWASSSRASAINSGGTIVGWNNAVANEQAHAWSWNVGGPITDLGVLPGDLTAAYAINDAGQIVGSSGAGFEQNPWLRQANGVVTFLGSLGGIRSSAQAINASATVVGGSDVPSGTLHPFRWSNGVMTDLGTLGGTFGSAFGIADDGRIVGTANIATGENHAFLWQNGQMTDLGTLGGPRSSAIAIKGNVVVGNAVTTGGELHAARWNVGGP